MCRRNREERSHPDRLIVQRSPEPVASLLRLQSICTYCSLVKSILWAFSDGLYAGRGSALASGGYGGVVMSCDSCYHRPAKNSHTLERVTSKPILRGSHHEYSLERICRSDL